MKTFEEIDGLLILKCTGLMLLSVQSFCLHGKVKTAVFDVHGVSLKEMLLGLCYTV